MKKWTAFWNIFVKDFRTYYLKPPNLSWGIMFPLAWTLMFFIRSGQSIEGITNVLPGITALSILFGTTSLLAVSITFEKKNRSFERLLLAPLPMELLMLAKTGGAILFGIINAFVPITIAAFLIDLPNVAWSIFIPAVVLISIASTFLGLFIAVAVNEVFEAQTFSNFFRFPMIFLSGLFFPISALPLILKPISFVIPLTYGADLLHGAICEKNVMPLPLDLLILTAFCALLFVLSLRNIKRKWIY